MIIIIISENKNFTSFDAACTQFASNVELKIDDAEDYFNWPKNIWNNEKLGAHASTFFWDKKKTEIVYCNQ